MASLSVQIRASRASTRLTKTPRPLLDVTNKQKEASMHCAVTDYLAAVESGGGRVKYGYLPTLLESYGITDRNAFYYQVRLATKEHMESSSKTPSPPPSTPAPSAETAPSVETVNDHEDDEADKVNPPPKQGGRPKGSTNAAKEAREEKKEKALAWAAKQLILMKSNKDKVDSAGHWKPGVIRSLAEEARKKFDVDKRDTINPHTIRMRYNRGSTQGIPGPDTPMKDVEPILLTMCIAMERIGKPFDQTSFCDFANSFIKGSQIEQDVIAFKKRRGVNVTSANLGKRYYTNFMKRHRKELRSKKPRKFPKDRADWATYDNIKQMYDNVYQAMIDAGVAEWLDDQEVEAILKHPDFCLFVDEVGINTNQKDGGNNNQRRFITTKDGKPHEECATNDCRATVMGFTAATGEPVMCAIILQGSNEDLPLHVRQGFDWMVDCDDIDDFDPGNFDEEFTRQHIKEGGFLAGGPTCTFRGKSVPCYITATPHGGITGEILKDMLRTMDEMELFERREGLCPFLLLDGHQSRLDTDFLLYVNNPATRWIVALGVPYGTHIWQVGDSPQQNGRFKFNIRKELERLYERKNDLGLSPTFARSDVVCIVRRAYWTSFGCIEGNRKAIAERGWGPEKLDRACLRDPEVLKTRTETSTTATTSVAVSTITPAGASHPSDSSTTPPAGAASCISTTAASGSSHTSDTSHASDTSTFSGTAASCSSHAIDPSTFSGSSESHASDTSHTSDTSTFSRTAASGSSHAIDPSTFSGSSEFHASDTSHTSNTSTFSRTAASGSSHAIDPSTFSGRSESSPGSSDGAAVAPAISTPGNGFSKPGNGLAMTREVDHDEDGLDAVLQTMNFTDSASARIFGQILQKSNTKSQREERRRRFEKGQKMQQCLEGTRQWSSTLVFARGGVLNEEICDTSVKHGKRAAQEMQQSKENQAAKRHKTCSEGEALVSRISQGADPTKLKVPELRTLCSYLKRPGDSPLKSRQTDLVAQYFRRSHRKGSVLECQNDNEDIRRVLNLVVNGQKLLDRTKSSLDNRIRPFMDKIYQKLQRPFAVVGSWPVQQFTAACHDNKEEGIPPLQQMVANDIDCYYGTAGKGPFALVGCPQYDNNIIPGTEVNLVELRHFDVISILENNDINATAFAIDVTAANGELQLEYHVSSHFWRFFLSNDHELSAVRPNDAKARTLVRLAFKSLQMGLPFNDGTIDPCSEKLPVSQKRKVDELNRRWPENPLSHFTLHSVGTAFEFRLTQGNGGGRRRVCLVGDTHHPPSSNNVTAV